MIQAISSAVPRRRTTLGGEVFSVTRSGKPFVRTDATISDGTGSIVLRLVGRPSVPGLELGWRVVVEGTPGVVHGDLVMLNPVYSFVSSSDDIE